MEFIKVTDNQIKDKEIGFSKNPHEDTLEVSKNKVMENTIKEMLNKVMEDPLNAIDSVGECFEEDVQMDNSNNYYSPEKQSYDQYNYQTQKNLSSNLDLNKANYPNLSKHNYSTTQSTDMINSYQLYANNQSYNNFNCVNNSSNSYYYNNIPNNLINKINMGNFCNNSFGIIINNNYNYIKNYNCNYNVQPLSNNNIYNNNLFMMMNNAINSNSTASNMNINNYFISYNNNDNNSLEDEKEMEPDYNNNLNFTLNSQDIILNQNINLNLNSIINTVKPLLEKESKITNQVYNLYIKGKLISIISSSKGSKIFQKYLKTTHYKLLHLLFLEIFNFLPSLLKDAYANYFCTKLFSYLTELDKIEFIKRIQKSFVQLCTDKIGTYPIQTMIEQIRLPSIKNLISQIIKKHVKNLSYDHFGSHVLEKILIYFEEEYIKFIYDFIITNFIDLATNNNGICIIKKILTFTHKKKLHQKIKNIVKENTLQLILHPYANFVIEIIVNCWTDYQEIISAYDKKYFILSLDKYASNVVERCIEKNEKILNNFVDEIMQTEKIYEVMKSNYGNYVIQKALKLAKGEYKKKLLFSAAKDVNKLNDVKLIIKWKSILLSYINELNVDEINNLKKIIIFNNNNNFSDNINYNY